MTTTETQVKPVEPTVVSETTTTTSETKDPRERTITYVAPFDKCDREEDYATAWAEFERRGIGK